FQGNPRESGKSWPCRACSHGWLYGGSRGVHPCASGPSACRSTAPLSRPHAERLTLRPDFHARRERPPRRSTHEHTRPASFQMRGASLPRSPPMELHPRVELIDTLLEDAQQKPTPLQHPLAAQTRTQEAREHARPETPRPHEGETLKYEQDLWQRVRT